MSKGMDMAFFHTSAMYHLVSPFPPHVVCMSQMTTPNILMCSRHGNRRRIHDNGVVWVDTACDGHLWISSGYLFKNNFKGAVGRDQLAPPLHRRLGNEWWEINTIVWDAWSREELAVNHHKHTCTQATHTYSEVLNVFYVQDDRLWLNLQAFSWRWTGQSARGRKHNYFRSLISDRTDKPISLAH